jgi:hypothetical protein
VQFPVAHVGAIVAIELLAALYIELLMAACIGSVNGAASC